MNVVMGVNICWYRLQYELCSLYVTDQVDCLIAPDHCYPVADQLDTDRLSQCYRAILRNTLNEYEYDLYYTLICVNGHFAKFSLILKVYTSLLL